MTKETTFEIGGAKITVATDDLFRTWLQTHIGAAPVASTPALRDGEVYAGIALDESGKPTHHLILLPGEETDVNHADAIAWAEKSGGSLPTRQEQSLLFANAKKHFKHELYWSSELHAEDGWAWFQRFHYGHQNDYRTSNALRARAVRRLVI